MYLAAEGCALIWPQGPLTCCNLSTDVLMSCLSQAFRWAHLHAMVPAGLMRRTLCCTQVWASDVLLSKAGLWPLIAAQAHNFFVLHLPTSYAQVAVKQRSHQVSKLPHFPMSHLLLQRLVVCLHLLQLHPGLLQLPPQLLQGCPVLWYQRLHVGTGLQRCIPACPRLSLQEDGRSALVKTAW